MDRIFPFPYEANEPLHLFTEDTGLKAHPAYRQAKSGDVYAALELIDALALDFLQRIKNLWKDLPAVPSLKVR